MNSAEKVAITNQINETGKARWQGTERDKFGHVAYKVWWVEGGHLWHQSGTVNPDNGASSSGASHTIACLYNPTYEPAAWNTPVETYHIA